jgi:hypothetical protein
VAKAGPGIRFNEHIDCDGPTVFAHACKLDLEGIVSNRKDSPYRSGRSPDWLKMKNSDAPAVKREAEEDWGRYGADAKKHLIELKALASELGITPDEIKQLADERRLPFSFTTTYSYCIHRRDLPAWRRAAWEPR